ncbi:MAG: NTP transferase domain-containing protein, partial [Bacteroidota bacterium]|nr:NTP transferase domain-containing protein [Bacteroidota bacterium]
MRGNTRAWQSKGSAGANRAAAEKRSGEEAVNAQAVPVFPSLVIFAAGASSRMKRSWGEETGSPPSFSSKAMINLGPARRPFLDYVLFNARRAGIRDVVLVVGEEAGDVRAVYGRRDRGNHYHGLELSYVVQPIPKGRQKPLGTADAALRAIDSRPHWAGDCVLVCNGDNLYSASAFRALASSPYAGAWADYDFSALGYPPERVSRFGVTVKDAQGCLVRIIEKPSPDDIARLEAAGAKPAVSMNLWKLPLPLAREYLERCPFSPDRGERELPTAISMMVKDHPCSMRAVPAAEHVPDLTSREDIPAVEAFLAREFGEVLWEDEKRSTP